jgi:hypothetical protein
MLSCSYGVPGIRRLREDEANLVVAPCFRTIVIELQTMAGIRSDLVNLFD